MAESDDLDDIYRFRTPPLRNVELTSPYGHNGAFKTLEGIISHHLNPEVSRSSWSISQAVLPEIREFKKVDLIIQNDRLEMERYTQKLDIEPANLGEDDIDALTAFLLSLTGRSALAQSMIIPDEVPSGLKVDK
jgi:cytochrome c peroxidase